MTDAIQSMKSDTLTNTEGAPTNPHGTYPQDTTPTSSRSPLAFVLIKGPPESPYKIMK